MRSPRQYFVSRQRCAGSQVQPDSSSTTLRSGYCENTPSQIRLVSWVWKACAWADVVLGVIARPADRGRRIVVGAAGMDADGEPVARGGGVDRPVMALAQRLVAARQQQHLHEARVGGAALDLVDGQSSVFCVGDHDAGAQPRLAVEPLARDPVVDGAREGGSHVLAEQELHAVEAVAGCRCRSPNGVEALGPHLLERGRRLAFGGPPIGARGQRRAGGVADGVQLIHAARLHDRLAPMLFHVGQQRLQARHRGMDVAIDDVVQGAETLPRGRITHGPACNLAHPFETAHCK